MKYKNWTLGQVEAVFNKLGGDNGVHDFLTDKIVIRPANHIWPIWKTIKLGTGITDANGFLQAIYFANMFVSDWIKKNNIISKVEIATEEIEIDLVKVTAYELGFKDGCRRDKLYDRVKQVGLGLCPPEVGLQLRLQYEEQLNTEHILVGMEPICHSDNSLSIFDLVCNGESLYLGTAYGYPNESWEAFEEWVFVRPRK